jgi:hypothetical protein
MPLQQRLYRTNAFIPPQNPARGSIVLGVTAVVLTSLLTVGALGFVVYRLGAKHGAATAEKPAPPPAPSSVSPEAPKTSQAASPTFDDDDVSAPPSSYLASLKARPSWGRFEDDVAGNTEQFAPQPSQPLDLFVRSTPLTGNVDRAYVICRFQSFNKHDSFAGDDLHVRAKFASMPQVAADGPEDANLGFASAPLVTLTEKDKVKLEVYDRDVFGMETITKATVSFAAPFNHVDDGAAVECRSLTGAPLAEAVRTYGAKADVAIAKVAKDKVDPYSPEWSADRYDQAAAERATADVAALLGWADPRTQKRIARIDAAMSKLDGERAQAFRTLHEAARDRVTFDRFDVKLGKVDCSGEAEAACTIHLSVTNHEKEALHFGAFLSPFAYVADAHSRPVRATGGGDIAPGATQEIALTSSGPHLTSGPSIVGICQGSRCAPLRVR